MGERERKREKPAERRREKCSGKFVWCYIPVAQLRKPLNGEIVNRK